MKAFFASVLFTLWMVSSLVGQSVDRPRNVILLICDGCSPASFAMARDYQSYKGRGDQLSLDSHLVGAIRTHSANSRVTDSAAAGTAIACGVKTTNTSVGVDTAGRPVASILEAAEAAGMSTGMVVTSTISHATPASFASHIASRYEQGEIARQELAQGIEVLFGGGARFFTPIADGGGRRDSLNLFDVAAARGYQIVRDREAFQGVTGVPVLGIFAPGHMAYEIDRDSTAEPSLVEMTVKSIELLDADPDGFFLLVEGSRIDHSGHRNDAAAHVIGILEFDEAFTVAIAFARRDGSTLVVSTSDHGAGGLAVGRTVPGPVYYAWYPEVIDRIPASTERLRLMAEETGISPCELLEAEAGVICTEEEEQAIQAAETMSDWDLERAIGLPIGREAAVGWTTSGHSGTDVNVYAFGPGSEAFRGHQDNTAIALHIANVMGFDLEALTASLRGE